MENTTFNIELKIDNPVAVTEDTSNGEMALIISQECAGHLQGLFQIIDLVTFQQADNSEESNQFRVMSSLNTISKLGSAISDALVDQLGELEDYQQISLAEKKK